MSEWRVKVSNAVATEKFLKVEADHAEINEHGDLMLVAGAPSQESGHTIYNLIVKRKEWHSVQKIN